MLTQRDALVSTLERFLDDWDVLVCLVASLAAFEHCPTGTRLAIDAGPKPYWTATGAYTMPFNTTGDPAMVIPLAQSGDGLPIGVRLIGRRWEDMRLVAIPPSSNASSGRSTARSASSEVAARQQMPSTEVGAPKDTRSARIHIRAIYSLLQSVALGSWQLTCSKQEWSV
jgi:hypothetical protein